MQPKIFDKQIFPCMYWKWKFLLEKINSFMHMEFYNDWPISIQFIVHFAIVKHYFETIDIVGHGFVQQVNKSVFHIVYILPRKY
jgi:hypothetical protein